MENAEVGTIIDSLEWILKDDRFGFGDNWKSEDEPACEEEMAGFYVRRTINYLKEQMPRVLTLEGAALAEVCWLENKKENTLRAVGVFVHNHVVDAYPPGRSASTYDRDKYGKTYRCWSSQPSEQQRKMTPWTIQTNKVCVEK